MNIFPIPLAAGLPDQTEPEAHLAGLPDAARTGRNPIGLDQAHGPRAIHTPIHTAAITHRERGWGRASPTTRAGPVQSMSEGINLQNRGVKANSSHVLVEVKSRRKAGRCLVVSAKVSNDTPVVRESGFNTSLPAQRSEALARPAGLEAEGGETSEDLCFRRVLSQQDNLRCQSNH